MNLESSTDHRVSEAIQLRTWFQKKLGDLGVLCVLAITHAAISDPGAFRLPV